MESCDVSCLVSCVTYTSRPAPGPVHPELHEHRSLRWEQDQAYEESLAADRAKAEAVARWVVWVEGLATGNHSWAGCLVLYYSLV